MRLPSSSTFSVPQPESLDGCRLLVVGLGESGLAIARWAVSQGAQVRVIDNRSAPPGRAALQAACPQVEVLSGDFDAALLDGVDRLGWSQGLSPLIGPAAALYAAAQAAGIPVWGELEFFAHAHAGLRAAGHTDRVVAITGTNGKTTTTRLVGYLCQQAGRRVAVCGNIGPALLDTLREAVEQDDLPEVWVIELASYQLWLSRSFVADAATVLNISQDHLDWHGSMADYLAAKQRIYAPGTVCVYNRDDPLTHPEASLIPASASIDVIEDPQARPAERLAARRAAARAARAEAQARAARAAARITVSFGLDAPIDPPAFGRVREGGLVWLAESVSDEDAAGPARRRRESPTGHLNRLMPVDALLLRGAHNQANVLAALALARAIGTPMAAMLHALRSFEGEPHRCERVAVIREVEWVDDSKGTNVGATVAALGGLGKRCLVILGGEGKGQDFSPLAPAVAAHASAVLLIGRDAAQIRAALAVTGVPCIDCASLEEAVIEADRRVRPGEAVLLSPACASFDMFRNYAHRAEVFVDAVRRLALEAGQPC